VSYVHVRIFSRVSAGIGGVPDRSVTIQVGPSDDNYVDRPARGHLEIYTKIKQSQEAVRGDRG
jgi:hypothetical protein